MPEAADWSICTFLDMTFMGLCVRGYHHFDNDPPSTIHTSTCRLCQNNSWLNIWIVKYIWEWFTELTETLRKVSDVI